MRKMLVMLLLILGAGALGAQTPTPPPAEPEPAQGLWLKGNLNNITFEEMIRHTADAQKIRFLYDPKKVAGDVTIVCPQEGLFLPFSAFFSVLQTFLKQAKLILSPFGEDSAQSVKFYEIIPAIEAISQSPTVVLLENLDNWTDMTADFVTLVVNLQYAEANSVRGALQNLVSRNGGQVNPIPGINSLIIADYSYNIRRLAMIIKMMDQPPRSPRLEVINVNYLDAEELVTSLTNLLNQRQQLLQTTPRRPGSPDDETLVRVEVAPYVNAIMVTGYDAGIELVRELVKKLDVEIPGATTQGKIHYYMCKNKDAEDLAGVLNDVLGSGVPTNQPIVPQPGVVGSQNVPTIVAHQTTNSLLVIATPSDYNAVLKIIEKIDVRSPQVLIEAAILEVRDDDDFQFGVELATVDGFANTSKDPRLSFGTSFGFSDIVDASGVPISTGGGVPAGRNPIIGAGGLLTLNKGTAFDIPLLVRFLKTQTDANVLQQPYLVTNDHTEATFEVNTEINLIQINRDSTGGEVQGSGEFVEAGITMGVTPHISPDGYVTLEIDLNITNFLGESSTPGVSPPRQQRHIVTFVTVPDSTTAVIGGLKSSETGKSVSKIPLLGDIPVLGELFKSQRTVERKTNLYIFLRPKIMKDANFADVRAEAQRRLDSAWEDSKRNVTPQKEDFFRQAREDLKNARTSKPGTARRSFDYQGLPAKD